MAYEFKLPDIGEGVVEGEIVRWLVKQGDVVRADQPMVEIMTDKATVEIPAPRGGRVLKLMFDEGQLCPVGKVLIAIDENDAAPPVASPVSHGRAVVAAQVVSGATAIKSATVPAASRAGDQAATAGAEVLATPATRKLARELGIDIATVTGTGPGGRVTSDDLRNPGAARAPQGGPTRVASTPAFAPPTLVSSAAAADVRVPFRGLRRRIAENMARSKHEAAHFTYVEEIDCTQLVGLRAKANERLAAASIKLSYLPFIIKATVDALKRFPQLNAFLDDKAGEIVQRREYHVGLASATDEGLVVPVLRHADRRSVVDLAREIMRLAAATKSGKAAREDLTGSTFTITSLGALGGVMATPIINYPEVAILGVHKISKRPAVFEDKIVIRDLMNLSISVDHRLVDGHDAARFVAAIKESIESPGLLFLDSI